MIIDHNTEKRAIIDGQDVIVRAVCDSTTTTLAKWTVKIRTENWSESFRIFVRAKFANFNTSLYLECDSLYVDSRNYCLN